MPGLTFQIQAEASGVVRDADGNVVDNPTEAE